MANAKICDRCGKVVSWCTGAGIQIHKHASAAEVYDLCPECEEDLRKFMEKGVKEAHDVNKQSDNTDE